MKAGNQCSRKRILAPYQSCKETRTLWKITNSQHWNTSAPIWRRAGHSSPNGKPQSGRRRATNALRSLIFEIDRESCELFTQYSIAHIRHTLDTRDEFYEAEINYLQDTLPTLSGDEVALSEAIAASPFRADIEREFGKQYFVSMDLQKKLFCEANIPLRQQESRLTNEYQKIMATAEISFDGKTLNLYGVQKYFEHPDRTVRAAAVKAYSKFYEDNEPRLEEIWSELIRIRNQMGKNLGYENYIPVGYLEQGRTDYGEKEVASFREQVRTFLVPLCQKLYDAQAKRLGIDHVMWYDEKMVFPDGNAEPAGDDAFMVRTAQKMYHEISPETGEFIDFMIDHELMDLQNKPGKASTGYMTSLPSLKAPFVFSCFNHTIFDMQVLTARAWSRLRGLHGHAQPADRRLLQ